MSNAGWKMGRFTLIAALVLGLLGASPRQASADEVVRLNTDARLRARPGERAPTIAKLSEGQTVRVIGREGRWLKVSVRGRVGWITRTQVTIGDDAPVAARPAQQSKKRVAETPRRQKKGWSSLDEDAVGEEVAEEEEEAPPPKKKAKQVAARKKKPVAKKPAKLEVGATVVFADEASVRQRPSKRADELYTAEAGEEVKVLVISEEGDWVRVQADDGTKGWVEARALLAAGGGDEELDDEEPAWDEEEETPRRRVARGDDDDDDAPVVRKKRKRGKKGRAAPAAMAWSANGGLGILSKKQEFTSPGMDPLISNYGLTNTAPAVVVGGTLSKPMGTAYALGLEGTFMMTVGGDGVRVPGMGGAMEVLSWSAISVDVRGMAGYKLDAKKGLTLGARVGYHRASVTVQDSMTVKLPSERLSGFTLGAGLDAPILTPKIGVRVGFDMLMGASLEQTAGRRDGETVALDAYYLTAVGSYKVNKQIDAVAGYTLSLEGFGFSGNSERDVSSSGGSRKDLQHVFSVGAAYRF